MHKRRLLKLADLLEADAKNKKGIKFDLGTWGTIGDEEKPLSCGTTACAMGLAAVSGAFSRQGLKHDPDYYRITFLWKGSRIDGLPAAQKLFDISMRQAEEFFLPNGDHPIDGAKAEKALAQRIRDFVAAA